MDKGSRFRTFAAGWLPVPLLLATGVCAYTYRFLAPGQSLVVAAEDGGASAALRTAVETVTTSDIGDWSSAPVFYQFEYGKLYEQIDKDLTAPTGLYDVVIVDNPWMARFRDKLMPLYARDIEDAGTFVEEAWKTARDDRSDAGVPASFRGVPYVGNVQLLCVNRDFYPKGMPRTWQDIIAESSFLKPPKYSFTIQGGSDPSDIVDDFMPIFRGMNNNFEEALKLAGRLGEKSPKAFLGFTGFETAALLMKERIGAGIVFSGWALAISQLRPKGPFRFLPVPGDKPEFGVWFLAIPRNAPHPDRAKKFIRWATSKKQMLKAAWHDQNPTTRRYLVQDCELWRSNEGDDDLNACRKLLQDAREVLEAQSVAFQHAIVRPACANWKSETEEPMGKAIRAFQEGEVDLESAVKSIRDAYCKCDNSACKKKESIAAAAPLIPRH